jgi:tripartite-type tricarboxylate transporter receptor subunit TctC
VLSLIVPAPGGSRTGRLARALASAIAAEAGGQVDVQAFDGAPEAYAALAAAPADGRTLGIVAADLATLHWRGQSSVTPAGLAPIARLASDPAGIHVRADDPAASVRDLAADIRGRPGGRKISGAGRGAFWHIAALRWHHADKLGALAWSAAASPREAVGGLTSGEVDVVVCSIPEARGTPQVRSVRTIGVMSSSRTRSYPNVPATAEWGVRLDVALWRGVAGPAGLPAAYRSQAAQAVRRAYLSAAFQSAMRWRGFEPGWAEAGPFAAFMQSEDRVIGAALRQGGLV